MFGISENVVSDRFTRRRSTVRPAEAAQPEHEVHHRLRGRQSPPFPRRRWGSNQVSLTAPGFPRARSHHRNPENYLTCRNALYHRHCNNVSTTVGPARLERAPAP
jgi:hypothetical protein